MKVTPTGALIPWTPLRNFRPQTPFLSPPPLSKFLATPVHGCQYLYKMLSLTNHSAIVQYNKLNIQLSVSNEGQRYDVTAF